jgi:hypothetical protein
VVSGVILFCLVATTLLRGILAMFGTKMQILGWLLLLVLLISGLPIFDYKIF